MRMRRDKRVKKKYHRMVKIEPKRMTCPSLEMSLQVVRRRRKKKNKKKTRGKKTTTKMMAKKEKKKMKMKWSPQQVTLEEMVLHNCTLNMNQTG